MYEAARCNWSTIFSKVRLSRYLDVASGCSEDESKAKGTFILPITLGMGDNEADQPLHDFAESSTTGQPDVEYPEDLVDKENCSEDGRHHSGDSPAEGAADDSEELDDEEEKEGSCLLNVYLGKRDQL